MKEMTGNIKEYIVKLPQNKQYNVESWRDLLKTLHKLLRGVPFAVGLNVIQKRIFYSLKIEEGYFSVLENQLYSIFPDVEVSEIKRDITGRDPRTVAKVNLKLKHSDFYPFLLFNEIEGSVLTDFFNQFNKLGQNDSFFFQVKILPVEILAVAFFG